MVDEDGAAGAGAVAVVAEEEVMLCVSGDWISYVLVFGKKAGGRW